MARLAQFATFFVAMVAILGGIHYYLWARLVRDTALPQPWAGRVTLALVALAATIPLSFFAIRLAPAALARAVAWPAYVWMGLMFLLFVLLGAGDLVRLAARLWDAPPDAERRAFLSRLVGGTVAAAAGTAGALGMRAALGPIEVREVKVALRRLPAALSGTTIVQLTDLHVGPTIGRAFVQDVVARVNALAPDLVAITGDLVDGSVAQLADAVAPLGGLRARHGVYFVTGNHEYYSGAREWVAELSRLGIRVLRNECVTIGEGDARFDLAGVDDWRARGLAHGHGHDLDRALAGHDPARACVLLAHQPVAVHEAAARGVALQLSGHTHGGQIWPFRYLVRLAQPFVAGLHRVGDTQIYVSRGTGFWGPPMRIAEPAEITRIVLTAA